MKNEIHWSQAIQIKKNQEAQKKIEKKEYENNLSLARKDVWNAMGKKEFISSHVADIAFLYGIEEEDLIYSLI